MGKYKVTNNIDDVFHVLVSLCDLFTVTGLPT